jgi:hypothetical protein
MAKYSLVSQLSAETRARYDRFRLMRSDTALRECPKCNRVILGNESVPDMRCPQCGTEFCFLHSIAHVGLPCQEYTRRMARENALNQQVINATSKPCPVCEIPTEKNGGTRCPWPMRRCYCSVQDAIRSPAPTATWYGAGCAVSGLMQTTMLYGMTQAALVRRCATVRSRSLTFTA